MAKTFTPSVELVGEIEERAARVWQREGADKRQTDAKWRQLKGLSDSALLTISAHELGDYVKLREYHHETDPDFQWLRGLAEGIGALGGHVAMSGLWDWFNEHEKPNAKGQQQARIVLQWAFEGIAGWHN
jgi:hypothetical protein